MARVAHLNSVALVDEREVTFHVQPEPMPGPTRVHPPDGFQRTSQFVGVARYHGPARPQRRGLLSSYSAFRRAPLVRGRHERRRLDVLGPARPRRAVDQGAGRRGAGALRHDPAALVEEEAALLLGGLQAAL